MVRATIIGAWAGALLLAGTPALGQPVAWKPEQNVEIVSSVAEGGGTDATARLLQRMLRERRLVDVIASVVNKPGGSGAETWTYLDSHAGDGRVLAISTPPLLTVARAGNPDFTPITILYSEYVLIAVRADSPIKDGRDLAARLKRDASSISLAVAPALGSHNHVAPALVARAAGGDAKKMRVQVFDTGSAAADAVIEGRIDVVSSTVGTLLSRVQSGKLRPLGLSASKRLGGPLATVPTWREQGIDVVLPTWRGVIGPRGMSREQVAYWENVFLKLSFDGEWLAEMSKQWWESTYLSSAETRKFLDEQTALLNGALADLGLVVR
jgi:putative tricarboxylic transport membrane protein